MLIGYTQSGHTLAGSLLNAHADVVIAHELDTLQLLERGVSGRELMMLIPERDREFAALRRRWTRYAYAVRGQFQGRTVAPRVVGDKKGARSTQRLDEQPALLERLRAVPVPLRVIHVTRNPVRLDLVDGPPCRRHRPAGAVRRALLCTGGGQRADPGRARRRRAHRPHARRTHRAPAGDASAPVPVRERPRRHPISRPGPRSSSPSRDGLGSSSPGAGRTVLWSRS